MKKKDLSVVLMVIGSIIICAIIYNEVRRRRMINQRQTIVSSAEYEMALLSELGIKSDSTQFQKAQERAQKAQAHIEQLCSSWRVAISADADIMPRQYSRTEQQKLSDLVKLNRQSLEQYQLEVEKYLSLGLAEGNPKIRFARQKMADMLAQIGELELRLAR